MEEGERQWRKVNDGGGEASDARRWTTREADVCYEDSREDGRRGRRLVTTKDRKKMDRGGSFHFIGDLRTKVENDELASVRRQRHRHRERTKTSRGQRYRHRAKTKTSSKD